MGKNREKKKKKNERKRRAGANRKPSKSVERIDVNMDEFEAILNKAKEEPLSEQERGKLLDALKTLLFLTEELGKKRVAIKRLKDMLFGATTEKTKNVLKGLLEEASGTAQEEASGDEGPGNGSEGEKKKSKGHGRNGADAYTGGQEILVPHESLNEGDVCPACRKGTLYKWTPGLIVRIKGQAPLNATIYKLEKLRCKLCAELFTAKRPEGVGEEKYDAESAAMISLLKYGSGLPFNRLQRLEGSLGIPLPAATQWEIVQRASHNLRPAFEELIRQAAQGEVLHIDDTTMKILGLSREEFKEGRKGVFTSGIVSIVQELKIALFFSGPKHAGENLVELLKRRAAELGKPIQMCDALSRNMPDELQTILANCLAHARRKFADVAVNFPDECLHVLTILKDVYRNDAMARREGMSPEQRLRFHKEQSGPRMAELETWMAVQIDERKVEPNSGLGEAIGYMQNHWEQLTLFLREPGAPIDNNLCERVLKKAILHRKNAYFYKTENGARVGDLYMSLIHTCELNGVNPFDYLTELQKHAGEIPSSPERWLPWNYRHALQGTASPCRS